MIQDTKNGATSAQYQCKNSRGDTYYLFSTQIKLRNENMSTIYFMSKKPTHPKGQPAALPAGYVVNENPRNGFLTLRKES